MPYPDYDAPAALTSADLIVENLEAHPPNTVTIIGIASMVNLKVWDISNNSCLPSQHHFCAVGLQPIFLCLSRLQDLNLQLTPPLFSSFYPPRARQQAAENKRPGILAMAKEVILMAGAFEVPGPLPS